MFTMMVGLPGSGKSKFARKYSEESGAIYISSDELRIELFGDVNNQDNNDVIFEEMRVRTVMLLKKGYDVVYDATNINSKRRRGFLNALPRDVVKRCVYMNTSYEDCIVHDALRERIVGEDVINRMYKSLQIPMYHEGFDSICIINEDVGSKNYNLEDLTKGFEEYEKFLKSNEETFRCVGLAQDNPHHCMSVDRHMYYAFQYGMANTYDEDMLIALLLHDIGKPFCKSFKDRYATFYGHENVSAQLAVRLLQKHGYASDYIIRICTLIQLHMRFMGLDFGGKGREKFKKEVGEELYSKIIKINNADKEGK